MRRAGRRPWTLALALAGLLMVGVAGSLAGGGWAWGWPFPPTAAGPGSHERPDEAGGEAPVERLRLQVLAVLPHDRGAFTQGLLLHEGALYESTGLHGRSTLREVDRSTGEVLRAVPLHPALFGEGLALVGERLIQLTWQQGVALVYDVQTFEPLRPFNYTGEGWGLCYDGGRLVMSDGTSSLFLRDAETFEVIGVTPVTLDGGAVERLNELECVGDHVYANVWQTETIVRVDMRSGRVDATIDATGLLGPEDRSGADVLNGIAYDPEQDTFLITGKLWPKLYEVRFVP